MDLYYIDSISNGCFITFCTMPTKKGFVLHWYRWSRWGSRYMCAAQVIQGHSCTYFSFELDSLQITFLNSLSWPLNKIINWLIYIWPTKKKEKVEKFQELTPGIRKNGMQKVARNSLGKGVLEVHHINQGTSKQEKTTQWKTVETETGVWNQWCEAEDKAGIWRGQETSKEGDH